MPVSAFQQVLRNGKRKRPSSPHRLGITRSATNEDEQQEHQEGPSATATNLSASINNDGRTSTTKKSSVTVVSKQKLRRKQIEYYRKCFREKAPPARFDPIPPSSGRDISKISLTSACLMQLAWLLKLGSSYQHDQFLQTPMYTSMSRYYKQLKLAREQEQSNMDQERFRMEQLKVQNRELAKDYQKEKKQKQELAKKCTDLEKSCQVVKEKYSALKAKYKKGHKSVVESLKDKSTGEPQSEHGQERDEEEISHESENLLEETQMTLQQRQQQQQAIALPTNPISDPDFKYSDNEHVSNGSRRPLSHPRDSVGGSGQTHQQYDVKVDPARHPPIRYNHHASSDDSSPSQESKDSTKSNHMLNDTQAALFHGEAGNRGVFEKPNSISWNPEVNEQFMNQMKYQHSSILGTVPDEATISVEHEGERAKSPITEATLTGSTSPNFQTMPPPTPSPSPAKVLPESTSNITNDRKRILDQPKPQQSPSRRPKLSAGQAILRGGVRRGRSDSKASFMHPTSSTLVSTNPTSFQYSQSDPVRDEDDIVDDSQTVLDPPTAAAASKQSISSRRVTLSPKRNALQLHDPNSTGQSRDPSRRAQKRSAEKEKAPGHSIASHARKKSEPATSVIGRGWMSTRSNHDFMDELGLNTKTSVTNPYSKTAGGKAAPANVQYSKSVERRERNSTNEFKYHEVVRKKSEREKLRAFTCPDCGDFINAALQGKGGEIWSRHELECNSRHRARFTPEETNESFWDLDFKDERGPGQRWADQK